MRHYIPVPTATGYAVAYMNHRGELISVMECATFGAAYEEAAAMTLQHTKTAICGTAPAPIQGNRYLRAFA